MNVMLGIIMVVAATVRGIIAHRRAVALVFRLLVAWSFIAMAGACSVDAFLAQHSDERVFNIVFCVVYSANALIVVGSLRAPNPLPKAKVVR